MKRFLPLLLLLPLLLSCGIRPITRHDNNISGVDILEVDESGIDNKQEVGVTDMPDFPEDIIMSETAPKPNSSTFSTIGDEERIATCTVGYCTIRNKGTGQYLVQERSRLSSGVEIPNGGIILGEEQYAQVFQVVVLDDGVCAFLTPEKKSGFPIEVQGERIDCSVRCAMCLSGTAEIVSASFNGPYILLVQNQSFLVTKTGTGAYTLNVKAAGNEHISALPANHVLTTTPIPEVGFPDLDPRTQSLLAATPYSDDYDFTDEWIFHEAPVPDGATPPVSIPD